MKNFTLVIAIIFTLSSLALAAGMIIDHATAAQLLTQRLDSSRIRNFQIRAYAKGKNCDILHIETLNLLPPMMEALANGTLVYGEAIPGGVNNYAQNNGFKSVLYTSRADDSFLAFGKDAISRSSILKMQACTNQIDTKSVDLNSNTAANKGKQLIGKIHKQYKIHSFYSEPVRSGSKMVIWLPEVAWRKLTEAEKSSIKAYMKSKYSNCGIGIGRIDGVDILADNIIPVQ